MPFRTTARDERIDWPTVRDRLDLAAVATSLLGPAPGRRGERGRRLWWRCPLGTHEDGNPSFAIDPGKPTWRCYGCGEHGDAATLVMRLQGVAFPDAIRQLAEQAGIVATSGKPTRSARPSMPTGRPPVRAAVSPPDGPTGLPLADALALVDEAEKRLWSPEGRTAMAYLESRGLTAETIRRHRLGWTPRVTLPTADGTRYWRASGITIPWLDGDRLAMVKIRQPDGREPRYAQAFADRPRVYPCPEAIRPGTSLVIVEGEFDAMLLGQELAGLASVITTGSASIRPEGSDFLAMLGCPQWFAAHDADDAGDKAAAEWPARAVRARPPAPGKDWGEVHATGFNRIRYVWGGILRRPGMPWDALSKERWGPGLTDPAPGIVIDRPARGGDA